MALIDLMIGALRVAANHPVSGGLVASRRVQSSGG